MPTPNDPPAPGAEPQSGRVPEPGADARHGPVAESGGEPQPGAEADRGTEPEPGGERSGDAPDPGAGPQTDDGPRRDAASDPDDEPGPGAESGFAAGPEPGDEARLGGAPGAGAGPDRSTEPGAGGRWWGRSRRTAVAAVAAVVGVAGGGAALWAGVRGSADPPPRPAAAAAGRLPGHSPASAPAAPTTTRPPAPAAVPTALDIPAIGVHTRLLTLGLNRDGTLEVPGKPLQAGWFRGSPAPGSPGPAVILGHVDSYATGPAVFYRLGAMHPHERISATRADRSTVVFTVDAVRSYAKQAFPTLRVYGNTPDPELRLITCSDWNSRTHSYDGNTVVFAHLTGR